MAERLESADRHRSGEGSNVGAGPRKIWAIRPRMITDSGDLESLAMYCAISGASATVTSGPYSVVCAGPGAVPDPLLGWTLCWARHELRGDR